MPPGLRKGGLGGVVSLAVAEADASVATRGPGFLGIGAQAARHTKGTRTTNGLRTPRLHHESGPSR